MKVEFDFDENEFTTFFESESERIDYFVFIHENKKVLSKIQNFCEKHYVNTTDIMNHLIDCFENKSELN